MIGKLLEEINDKIIDKTFEEIENSFYDRATATEVCQKAVDSYHYRLRGIEMCDFDDVFYKCRSIFRARQILAQSHSRLSEEDKVINKEAIECYNQMIKENFFL